MIAALSLEPDGKMVGLYHAKVRRDGTHVWRLMKPREEPEILALALVALGYKVQPREGYVGGSRQWAVEVAEAFAKVKGVRYFNGLHHNKPVSELSELELLADSLDED